MEDGALPHGGCLEEGSDVSSPSQRLSFTLDKLNLGMCVVVLRLVISYSAKRMLSPPGLSSRVRLFVSGHDIGLTGVLVVGTIS